MSFVVMYFIMNIQETVLQGNRDLGKYGSLGGVTREKKKKKFTLLVEVNEATGSRGYDVE